MSEDAAHAVEDRPTRTAHPLRKRQVAAVAVGNAIEFYDFVTYAFFATQIGRTFFPSDEPGASLLASLATFGAGFLTRPLGAWVIGRMGDRRGRKPAMLLSFGLIGVAVIGLPLVPSYASIGVAAPVLVVMFRLLQGFALGGEVGPSTAFLMEAAPLHRRGLYISMQAMGADAAVLVAGLVGVALAHALTPAQLDAWGWRVALGLGAVIVPFGLLMRRTLEETSEPRRAPSPRVGRIGYLRVALLGIAMLAAATTSNYVLEYMTTYANTTLGLSERVALGATALVGLCGLVCDPLSGWLSDRLGRKPVMLVPWLVLLVAILPAFWLLDRERSGAVLYLITVVLTVASTLSTGTVLVAVTESLPAHVRSGALALVYALAISVFGGSTQFVVAWLTRLSGNALAPAWYMIGAVLVGLLAASLLPESAPVRQSTRTPAPE
ncbi:MFS transporter [Dyella sp.]|jgi:MFS family permease|uniref:MFS transporter n=1 Tax=Dyella sp. TaxID=1869338 RepID=UPI002D765A9D|nr:MFS transporter [Dyella sp.]HET6432163.1 MFS transporter [Dyella sp.]